MFNQLKIPILAILLLVVLVSSPVNADYGEKFLYVKCNPESDIFEVEPLIIWNEDLDTLRPAVERSGGILEKDDFKLYSIDAHREVDSSCRIGDTNIRLNFDLYAKNNLELYKNEKLTITASTQYISFSVLKIRYSSSDGWEESCSSVWQPLERTHIDKGCEKPVDDYLSALKSKPAYSVITMLMSDLSLREAPMVFQVLENTADVCSVALEYVNDRFLRKTTDLQNLNLLRDGSGTLSLPRRTIDDFVKPSIFDFDNDGKNDRVFSYTGGSSYINGNIFYVDFEFSSNLATSKKSLSVSDVIIFPCQFDPRISSPSSCPTISQEADSTGIDVSFPNSESVVFRGRYTYMVPFRHNDKTYIILKSASKNTQYYSAVIFPYERTRLQPVCLFKRQP